MILVDSGCWRWPCSRHDHQISEYRTPASRRNAESGSLQPLAVIVSSTHQYVTLFYVFLLKDTLYIIFALVLNSANC